MKKPLSDQVVVVAGASSGSGRATARMAGERGAQPERELTRLERLDRGAPPAR